MSASTDDPAVAGVFRRPFDEQLAFFRGKLGNLVPTERWDDIWKAAHDRAFMVAGAAKADLLADLASAVDGAIADGKGIDWFRAQFDAIVDRHGWSYRGPRNWRTRVIYTTNAATSYAAGRLAQLKQGGFALWVYRHSDSVLHPRPLHLAWDGLTLPADHPFWQTHYPPNGWGCRCSVVGANGPAGARLIGGDPDKPLDPTWLESGPNGEPAGVDRGWGYMPGATVADEVARAVAAKTIAWPYEMAKAYMSEVPERMRDALALAIRRLPGTAEAARRYAERALGVRNDAAIPGPVIVQQYQTLGLLTQAEARAIADMTGVEAVRSQIYDWTIDASTVRKVAKDHGDDAAQARSGQTGVTVEDYALLPRLIAEADRLEYGGTSGIGRPVVRLVKRFGDLEYWAAFEVRARRRMLALQTLWIRGRPPIRRP